MQVARLTDGTAVWLDPMRDVKSLALGIFVAAGSADEAQGERGSTHFLEHLLFKRTRRRSGAAIARITDRLGGDCDAYTTKECVAFHARVPAARAAEAVDLLLDLTAAPAFTAADVDVERAVILEEIAEAHDVPDDLLHDTFVRALWPRHDLGAPIFGTKESVSALTRATLAGRFRAIFRPERTLIVAAGALDPDRLVGLLERGRSRRARAQFAALPGSAPRAARCAVAIPRADLGQAHLLVGSAARLSWGDPRVPAAWIAAEILGGGVSSRLWRDVREARGLAYHVGAHVSLHRAAGLAVITAATQPKNLGRLVRTTGRVLGRLLRDGVSRTELARAKNQFAAEAALSQESTASRRDTAARAWLSRGRPYETEEYLADVAKVTAEDVAEAAALLWGDAGRMGLGVSGPLPDARAAGAERFARALADEFAGEAAA
ncbi:MAG: insulinase family protein [Acidobacteria bacterium]|nr:insulinase family protein [Acidobacteriota bacterium]